MSEAGHGDAGRLERRARRLLRACPPAYRAGRGEEVTGTLLEAAPPGRDRPPSREAASVIAAGLRARRAANLRQGLPASLRQAAVVGAAVYLVQFPCEELREVLWRARAEAFPFILGPYDWFLFLAGVLMTAIFAAAWTGRRRLVAAAAAAALIPTTAYALVSHEWDLMVILAEFAGPALVVFLPLARRAERPPLSLLWLPCLPLGVILVEAISAPNPALFFQTVSQTMLLSPYTTYLSLVAVGVAAWWLVTDVRPLMALAFAFTLSRVINGVAYARSSGAVSPADIAIAITASALPACTLAWLLRHRTRASSPAAG